MVLLANSTPCSAHTKDICPAKHKRRSFMVTDILTDQTSSMETTAKNDSPQRLNMSHDARQLPFDLTTTATKFGLSSTSTDERDARICDSPMEACVASCALTRKNLLAQTTSINPGHSIATAINSTSFEQTGTSITHSSRCSSSSPNESDDSETNEPPPGRSVSTRQQTTQAVHGVKPMKKLRKARTAFTDQQLNELEHSFDRQKYLAVQDRMELAARLGLSDMQVKTWYQNRRTKWKRQTAVGLELLAEADNFVAVQRLLQQSTYWAYHPAAQCILGNGDLLGRPHGSGETDLVVNQRKNDMTDPNRQKDLSRSFPNTIDQNSSPLDLNHKMETSCHSLPSSDSNVTQSFTVVPPSLSFIPAPVFTNPMVAAAAATTTATQPPNTFNYIREPASLHAVNPADLFWLSSWLSNSKATRSRSIHSTQAEPHTKTPAAKTSTEAN